MVSEHASPLATLGGVDAGGQNVHVAALATQMGAEGHDITVYTRRDAPELPEVVDFAPGVRVHHVTAGPPEPVPKDELFEFMPAFADVLACEWHDRAPVVCHSHFWMSGWAAARAARRTDVPIVHTYHALGVTKRRHQGGKDTSPAARLGVERALALGADHIVATSSEEIFELLRMGSDAPRISLVPCGVDLEQFAPRRRYVAAGSRPARRVLVVSRLVERKGIGNVVTAMTELPDAQLVIAGGPPRDALMGDPEAQRLSQLARELGVHERVELIGRVPREDLPALYASAEVVVCVPWYEPFGLVALEAMACGRPVVASAVGGLVDTVIDGVNGLLVPPRNPGQVAAAIRRVLDDLPLQHALALGGRRRARSRYGWSTVARETVRAYVAACRGASGSRRRVG
jgi:glycosyltransferase involved in cell wall biosynthesis